MAQETVLAATQTSTGPVPSVQLVRQLPHNVLRALLLMENATHASVLLF